MSCHFLGLPLDSWAQSPTHFPSPAASALTYLRVKFSLSHSAGETGQELQ